MGAFFWDLIGSMGAKNRENGLFLMVFFWTWASAAGILSPKGVNFEGILDIFHCFFCSFELFFPQGGEEKWATFKVAFVVSVQDLMSIKASLKDPHSVLENWDQDSVDPCSWAMVTCSPDNLVISL